MPEFVIAAVRDDERSGALVFKGDNAQAAFNKAKEWFKLTGTTDFYCLPLDKFKELAERSEKAYFVNVSVNSQHLVKAKSSEEAEERARAYVRSALCNTGFAFHSITNDVAEKIDG